MRVQRDGDTLVVFVSTPTRDFLRGLAVRLEPLLAGEATPRRGLIERRRYRAPELVRSELPSPGSKGHADVLEAVRRFSRDLGVPDDVRLDDQGLQQWLCALGHLKPLVVPRFVAGLHENHRCRPNRVAITLRTYQNLLLSAAEPDLYAMAFKAIRP
jgi:hypothetical protein